MVIRFGFELETQEGLKQIPITTLIFQKTAQRLQLTMRVSIIPVLPHLCLTTLVLLRMKVGQRIYGFIEQEKIALLMEL